MGYINNVYPSWYIDINIISFFGDISLFMRIYQKFGYILLQYIVIYRRIDISKYINSGYIAIYREISWYIAEYLEISRYIFSFLTNLLISTDPMSVIFFGGAWYLENAWSESLLWEWSRTQRNFRRATYVCHIHLKF